MALIALLAAGVIGWSIGQSGRSSRKVTSTVTVAQPPPTIYQHTPQGAVAAAQVYLSNAALLMCPGCKPAEWSPSGVVSQVWQLAYRVESYTSGDAIVRTWGLTLDEGGTTVGSPPTPAVEWNFADTSVRWTGSQWQGTGQTVGVNSAQAVPPVGGGGSAAGRAFAGSLSGFARFPGAP